MGGRVAEEIKFGYDAVTSGASSDINAATDLARAMVTEWGMSDALGPIRYSENSNEVFLGRSVTQNQNMSEETARLVDAEIKRLVTGGYEEAKKILQQHQKDWETLAQALMEYETLTGEEIQDVLAGKQIDKNKDISVLRDISFEANYGEFVSILGVSGSGKSTLLNCISSLSAPTEGVVKVNNCNPYQLKNSRLSKFRREDISFIFQSYNLLPALPVLENVALPLRLSHKKVCRDDIQTLLDKMNFRADLMSPVSSLSGGEKQKVAIARAILSKTRIIFADEPTGALDSTSRKIIFEMLADLAQEGRCVIMVTHDIELASQTDRALILKDGKIYQELFNPTAEALYKALEIENSGD